MSQELLLNGFYQGESPKNSLRTAVNWVATKSPPGSLSQYGLYPTAGITGPQTVTVTAGASSGDITAQVSSYVTDRSRDVVFFKDSNLFLTEGLSVNAFLLPAVGVNNARTDYARVAATDNRLVVVAPSNFNGGDSYAWEIDREVQISPIDIDGTLGDPVSQIEDVTFAAGRVIWMSSKVEDSEAFRCYYSDIGAVAPDPNNFFQPDSASTKFTGIVNLNGSIYLFTEDRTYLFSITASASTPFQWQRSATVEVGLIGPHAKDYYQNSLVFVGRRSGEGYKVMLFTGGNPQPISTPAIDYQLQEDFRTSFLCRVFTFSEKGKDYTAVQTFQRCFVYSHNDQNWHERRTGNDIWEVVGAGFDGTRSIAVGRTVLANGNDLTINAGRWRADIGTEFSQPVTRECITSHYNDKFRTIRLSELEAVCEVDTSFNVPGEPTPAVGLQVSNDYGENYQYSDTGLVQSSTSALRFFSLGYYRQAFTVRLTTSSRYPVRVLSLLSRLKQGSRER